MSQAIAGLVSSRHFVRCTYAAAKTSAVSRQVCCDLRRTGSCITKVHHGVHVSLIEHAELPRVVAGRVGFFAEINVQNDYSLLCARPRISDRPIWVSTLAESR